MNIYARLILCLCISLTTWNLQAQEFEDFVKKYTGVNGEGFMQPLADAFGANLNSGWYHNAYIEKQGFQLYIGVTAMTAIINENNKTFNATTEEPFSPTTRTKAPTIFGNSESVIVQGEGGTVYAFPGGLDLNRLPLAAPTLTVGSLYGTNASVRWAAYDIGDEVGKIQLLGWGVRHKLDQYFPTIPVHLAVGFYMQQFSMGDIIEANGWLTNIQASYQWRFLTFYGGLGVENSTLDMQYTYETDESEIAFNLKGNNKLRGTLGLTLNLGSVKIHSDYNLASQSLFTLGLGLGINEIERMEE